MSFGADRFVLGLVAGVIGSLAVDLQVPAADRNQATPPARRIVVTPGRMPPLPSPASAEGSWGSFRGERASGIADGQQLPDAWNVGSGENILWRTPIPGLAHSSPIVWGDRVFVTTAVSSRDDATFKTGMFGEGTPSDDRSVHRWLVYALDTRTGRIIWERIADEGVPIDKRHVKSTYASATPATDGRIVVAWFGSQGVYAYNVADGTLRWKVDVGHLDVGAYDVPTLEWGTASSPIIWNDFVFLQCDTHTDSFMLALKASTGEVVWKSDRAELPSWGTPTVVTTAAGSQLIANGSNFIRSYEPLTGKELWRLGPTSQITVPTPIFSDGLIVVASGRVPEKPIFAIRPAARGDISLAPGAASDAVAWSRRARGPYMPTPLAYQGVLYVLNNNAVFQAYTLDTGAQIYETRVPQAAGGFHASPIAADGRIYICGEDGDIIVIRAGREFTVVATNSMGEPLMATPALSRGVMFVRTPSNLFAVARTDKPLQIPASIARVALPTAESARPAVAALTLVITAAGSEAAAFAGTWEANLPTGQVPMTATLKLSGDRVAGELAFSQTLPIEDGRVDGRRISFKVKSPNGERLITFTGTLKDDEIAFVRTVEIRPGGRPGGAGLFGVDGVPEFVALRTRRQEPR